jgi:hypothetical protein
MFNMIFETRFKEFFGGVFVIFQSEVPLFEKIKNLIHHEIDTFSTHPDLARFVIAEIAQQPERLIRYGQKMNINPRTLIQSFEQEVQQEVNKGSIIPVEGKQLIMNIMSLCIYPFVARPIIKTMMQMDEGAFMASMNQRKKEVYEFIINAIRK